MKAGRARSLGHTLLAVVPLTRERLAELEKSQERWLHENVLGRPPGAAGEEMCLILWDVFQLTSGASS